MNQVELGRERIRDACRIAGVEKEVCCLIFQSHVSRYFLSEAYCLMQHGQSQSCRMVWYESDDLM